jgi:hypothetical protein
MEFLTFNTLFESFRPVAFLRDLFAVFSNGFEGSTEFGIFYTYIEFSQQNFFGLYRLFKKLSSQNCTKMLKKRKTSVIMCLTVLFWIYIRFVMHNFVNSKNQCSLLSIPPTAYILCVLVQHSSPQNRTQTKLSISCRFFYDGKKQKSETEIHQDAETETETRILYNVVLKMVRKEPWLFYYKLER